MEGSMEGSISPPSKASASRRRPPSALGRIDVVPTLAGLCHVDRIGVWYIVMACIFTACVFMAWQACAMSTGSVRACSYGLYIYSRCRMGLAGLHHVDGIGVSVNVFSLAFFISASRTACLLRGHGRAGTQNDRLGEAVILSTGTSIPAQ